MLTINTKTKRFTLKGDEEQSERLFGLLVAELLNLAGGGVFLKQRKIQKQKSTR